MSTKKSERVRASWLAAYSLPGLPIAAMGLPLAVHLPPYYASEIGMGYAIAGTVFMLPRFLDIFIDPVMGVLSDRFRTPWGRRKPWMAMSVPVLILAAILVFMPAVGTTWPVAVLSLVLLFIGWTESDSYCSSLHLLRFPVLFVADCQTADAGVGGPALPA